MATRETSKTKVTEEKFTKEKVKRRQPIIDGKYAHFWEFQGHDTETGVEYSNCPKCGKWRAAGKPITHKAYRKRLDAGKIIFD